MWLDSNANSVIIRTANPTHADRDLERRVKTFLSTQHRPGLRSVKVEARSGIVTLRGRVGSFYEKQLSGQLTRRVAGVIRLIDDVSVKEIRLDRRKAVSFVSLPSVPDQFFNRGKP
jgi:osmotically-inducible protein OsmY